MTAIHRCLFLTVIALATAAGYDGLPDAGLRWVERIDERTLRAEFGPACNPNALREKLEVLQIASATDPAFRLGVACADLELSLEPDARYPDAYAGPRFQRVLATLTVPPGSRLDPAHRYWLRANSAWVINGRRGCWIEAEAPVEPTRTEYGIRHLRPVRGDLLQLSLGPGVDLDRLTPDAITIVPEAGGEAITPTRLGRRSRLDFYHPDGWPWRPHLRHEVFLELPQALAHRASYRLELAAGTTCGRDRIELRLDDRESECLALKVNQVGYLPSALKVGYLGSWMGTGGAADFAAVERIELRDADTHAAVMILAPALRQKATYRLESGKRLPEGDKLGREGVYKEDLSYEDIYQIDFSALRDPGRYYLAIPEVGRSFAFTVSPSVYAEPFATVMNGIFHQRCGCDLDQPYSAHFRPACHRGMTEYTDLRHDQRGDIRKLTEHATDRSTHDLWGGHHDAGDWNPRSHLEVAEWLLPLYELNPDAFADGQLAIPEAGNGIPDLLDEAAWAFDLWIRMQDADGGVRGGIESAGDPLEGDIPATDRLREFAFAKEAGASYRFAAVMAEAAIVWRSLGRGNEADGYLERARRAWAWAEANGGADEHDQHAYAAAVLLRATGEPGFAEAFAAHAIWARDPAAAPRVYGKHDQVLAGFHYARCEHADPSLAAMVVASFERTFAEWRQVAETTGYPYMRDPWAPNTWGTGGLPKWCLIPAVTMALTEDPEIRSAARAWLLRTNDFSLGCHPLNLVFTVGVGQRSVTSAYHHLQLNSPAGSIPGLQSEGAGVKVVVGEDVGKGGMGKWPAMCFDPPGRWPSLYLYADGVSPGMNEGLVVNQVLTAFAYGLHLPPVSP